jgi:hypothetical protein
VEEEGGGSSAIAVHRLMSPLRAVPGVGCRQPDPVPRGAGLLRDRAGAASASLDVEGGPINTSAIHRGSSSLWTKPRFSTGNSQLEDPSRIKNIFR